MYSKAHQCDDSAGNWEAVIVANLLNDCTMKQDQTFSLTTTRKYLGNFLPLYAAVEVTYHFFLKRQVNGVQVWLKGICETERSQIYIESRPPPCQSSAPPGGNSHPCSAVIALH